VEWAGFGPATSALRRQRATRLRHHPIVPAVGAAGYAGEPLSDRLRDVSAVQLLALTEPVTEGLTWSAPKGDAPPAPTSGLRVQLFRAPAQGIEP
jgi:hypothetical protein